MNLFQISVIGAVLILVIGIIRRLAMNRLPKNTFLILWAIVILRLLTPVAIPSEYSIYSFAKQNVSQQMLYERALGDAGTVERTMWRLLWIIGCIVCMGVFSLTYMKCRKTFAFSLPVKNEFVEKWFQEHKLWRAVEIRQSAAVKTPLTYGCLHPVILVPRSMDWENETQNMCVLAHELVHIKRFDVVMKAVLVITVCIHWFNPFVWLMYLWCNRDMELSCDESVIRTLGENAKADYAYALISMEEMKRGFMPLCSHFSKNAIEERITAIMKMKKVTTLKIASACMLVGCVAVLFATNSKAETAVQDETQLAETVSNNTEKGMDVSGFGNISVCTTKYVVTKSGKEIVIPGEATAIGSFETEEELQQALEQYDIDSWTTKEAVYISEKH